MRIKILATNSFSPGITTSPALGPKKDDSSKDLNWKSKKFTKCRIPDHEGSSKPQALHYNKSYQNKNGSVAGLEGN